MGSLVTDAARLSSYRALLRNRNYRLWFVSALGSSLGDWVGLVALQTLIVSLSESNPRAQVFGLGAIMAARLVPSMVVGPVAGVISDRYDRKRLMVFTDLARGSLFVGIAFSRELSALLALTFAVECLSLLYMSAKDASLPVIVERRHLTQANQLNLLVSYGTLPFGAFVATALVGLGALLQGVGLAALSTSQFALLLNAGTFVAAGLLVTRVRMPEHGRRADTAETSGILGELREGLQFIRERHVIRSLIVGVVGAAFGAGVVVALGPAFVKQSLDGRGTDWAPFMAVVGTGLVVGILLVPILTARFPKERVFPVVLSATAVMAMVVATMPSLPAASVAGFLLGGVSGLSFVIGYTLLGEHADDEVRGKTFAAFYTVTRIAMFSALVFGPFLAGGIDGILVLLSGRTFAPDGVRITAFLSGLVALAAALLSWRGFNRALRERPAQRMRLPWAGGRLDSAGVLIAFEGVEGSGKSTQMAMLARTLREEGRDVVVTREPGGSRVAERVRELVLDRGSEPMNARTEALLYAAARAEHVDAIIRPALEAGKVVLTDRYVDSSLVYQGQARGLGEADVAEVNRWATEGVLPDAVVLLDLDPEEGLRRAGRRSVADRIEGEGQAFHHLVAQGYLRLARSDRRRYVVVPADGDEARVAERVRAGLRPWLPRPDKGPTGRRDETVEPRRDDRVTR
ncbi:MAG: dTMP kinase [Actinobacteria bacterium]|nr:dTMP kinase [Actinomycetota bacterium]